MPISSVDDNLAVNLNILGTIQHNGFIVDQFKSQVASSFKENNSAISKLGVSLSKSFSIQALGSKIGDAFNKTFKTITTPFTAFGGKISSMFNGLKTTLSNLSPVKAIGAIKNKFTSVKEKATKLLGKDLDSLQKKFYSYWSAPGRIVSKITKANEKLWKKYGDKSKATINKKILSTVKKNNNLQNGYYSNWSKPKKVATIFAKEFQSNMGAVAIVKSKAPVTSKEQLFGTIAKSVEKISNAVTWFLGGPGLGIALAVGLVPPILILSAAIFGAVWLVCDTIKAIWEPLSTKVSDGISIVVDILGTVKNFLLRFLDSPISTVASGIKTVFGVGQKNETEQQISELDSILSKLKIFNSLEIYIKRATEYFGKVENNLKHAVDVIEAFMSSLSTNFIKGLSTGFNAVSTVFKNTASKIKDFFTKPAATTNTSTNTTREETNPFTNLISSFEAMRKDTVQLLTDIKTSIISIEKNKIQVGSVDALNTAIASDAKKTNELQQINYNYNTDTSDIIPKIEQTNKLLEGILINTSIKDSGENKANAVWSI